eukprot:6208925-Pleurochrysis_carterae.AAC.3
MSACRTDEHTLASACSRSACDTYAQGRRARGRRWHQERKKEQFGCHQLCAGCTRWLQGNSKCTITFADDGTAFIQHSPRPNGQMEH